MARGATIPALALASVWTLGFEVAPLAHAIEHASTPPSRHCHDGTCHDDDAGIASASHGEHTLAHRDVAATTPHDAVLRWPAFVVGEAIDLLGPDAPVSAREPSDPTARGPPRA